MLVVLLVALALALTVGLLRFFSDRTGLVALIVMLFMLPVIFALVRNQLSPILQLFRAMSGTVISYQDGDYSFSLHWHRSDELAELVDAHNALGNVLREQRLDMHGEQTITAFIDRIAQGD